MAGRNVTRFAVAIIASWMVMLISLPAQTTVTLPSDDGVNKLTPRTSFEGAQLEFNFPSLQIGVAEYEEGPTGATVFYFPKGAAATVDVRGGAPGTTNTDWLQLGYGGLGLDAICFAGGSWYGLEAASGVRAELLATKTKDPFTEVANVAGAIVYDFPGRMNTIYADKELGRAALRAARPNRFPLGARGAGRFVSVGKYIGSNYREQSGQGGAFRQSGATKIAVFTVVNSLGAIVDRQGRVVRGLRDPQTGARLSPAEAMRRLIERAELPVTAPTPETQKPMPTNTTLTLVVTNQKLEYWQLRRLAVQVHTSMGRVIQPFQMQADGDVLFAATTGEVENARLPLGTLALLTSEAAYDAVLSSIPREPEFRPGARR
ncbi:MAG: P1 family peptidase [Acidobacteriota bacterium]|nr:P1 family peptidase [Acidobacteriota bacterium]